MLVIEPCIKGGIIVADTDTDNWTHVPDSKIDQLLQDIKDNRDYYKGATV